MLLMRVVDPAVLAPDERGEQAVHVLEQLKRIADEMRHSGLEVDVRVSTGEVVAEIMSVAESERADALIVATHTSLMERLVDSSTARRLIARSRIPVFVIRPGGRRITAIHTLLVAVDGSPGAAQALDEAVGLARLTNAALVLVRVVPAPEHFGFDPLLATTLAARPNEEAEAHALAVAEEYVNDLARKLRARGLNAAPKVMIGSPAERILAAADQLDVDVIVMSTRAYLEPLRTLLGSTADQVAQAARRPVLLVRRTGARASSAHPAVGSNPAAQA